MHNFFFFFDPCGISTQLIPTEHSTVGAFLLQARIAKKKERITDIFLLQEMRFGFWMSYRKDLGCGIYYFLSFKEHSFSWKVILRCNIVADRREGRAKNLEQSREQKPKDRPTNLPSGARNVRMDRLSKWGKLTRQFVGFIYDLIWMREN